MKKFVLKLAIVLSVFGFYCTAAAMPVTLTDVTSFTASGTNAPEDFVASGGGAVNVLDFIGDYVTWLHQYEFNPPLGTITSASLSIALQDDENDSICRPSSYELGLIYDESGRWAFGEIDTGTYGYNLNAAYLEDERFKVTIASLWGDFTILSSTLTINYDSDNYIAPASVPEPASLLFLGIGLFGMFAITKKKFRIK